MPRQKSEGTAKKKIAAAFRSGVAELTLSRYQLTALPESLGQLTQLRSLDLSHNHLTVLPKWLGQLTQLESLYLSYNQLTALPRWLGQLTQLKSLHISCNQLTVLPESLGQLTQLRSLCLRSNRLTMLPESLGELAQLQVLELYGNLLTALPESLGQLRQLQSLELYGNQLEALPESLCELTQFQSLDVSHNQLTTLPKQLSQLAQLQSLDVSHNHLIALPKRLGELSQLQSLDVSRNKLTVLPKSLGQLAQLQSLNLSGNGLTALPEAMSQLTQLQFLNLSENRLTRLPENFANLCSLETLFLGQNPLCELPSNLRALPRLRDLRVMGTSLKSLPCWIGDISSLERLDVNANPLADLPDDLGKLTKLESLWIGGGLGGIPFGRLPDAIRHVQTLRYINARDCQIRELPHWLSELESLGEIDLSENPLNPELAAAYEEGLDAVKRYLRAKAEAKVVLNEAKLILVGEGEVGKSCLLSALRGEPWEEARDSTHGIEIKPVNVIDPATGTAITLNGWDFGGQRVYRPTHQLFFSAPAVYLVVWKPREGPQQGFVKEWIKLVKHREPEAKILVVATHGGPGARQPDIDRQEIWELFGKDTVIDFFFVDSKPSENGACVGIEELRDAIGRLAAGLPEMGRTVPKRWQEAREALKKKGVPYLPLDDVLAVCAELKMDPEEARLFVTMSHRLGHLIHYERDPTLRNIVVLKPDWLATAMSFVLDDKQTRDAHGLVSFARLGELWNDSTRAKENRYPSELHPVFLGLMERYDLSYVVAGLPMKGQPEGAKLSLIAQLVPDIRPDEAQMQAGWPVIAADGDEQRMQICRIAEDKNGQSASAEGLFFQLIVRLHKYSLGRENFRKSLHWQRGLVLDDDYNGRALLEHTGNDVRITVRAAYPEAFLAVLTREVKWLVESFWAGLRCDVMVPCIDPCGKSVPGTGLYEVQKLIESKRRKRPEYPCPVCSEWQSIDSLLRNAAAERPAPLEELLAEFATVKAELTGARQQLIALRGEAMGRFDRLDLATQRLLSRVDDAYTRLMQTLTDEAKDGPRLFSFQPVDPGFFDRPSWTSQKFRLTLWCEHSRLPLLELNGKASRAGVYELNLPREWLEKAAPFLKVLSGTLSLVLPVAASATKLVMEDAAYKGLEKELDLGQKSLDSVLKGGEKSGAWLGRSDAPDLEHGDEAIRAQGAVLRQLHAWLKEKDPSFGGLVRVQNKRQEFLWVHPQFAGEY